MLAISKAMFESVQDEVEKLRQQTFDLNSSTDDLSAFFSQNLNISGIAARTPSRRSQVHQEDSSKKVAPSSKLTRKASNPQRPEPSPAPSSRLPSSQQNPLPTSNEEIPAVSNVLRRGRPKVYGRATKAKGGPVQLGSKQPPSSQGEEEEDDDIIFSSQVSTQNPSVNVQGRGRGRGRRTTRSASRERTSEEHQPRSSRSASPSLRMNSSSHLPSATKATGQSFLPSPERQTRTLSNGNSNGIGSASSDNEIVPESVPLDSRCALDEIVELYEGPQLPEVSAREEVREVQPSTQPSLPSTQSSKSTQPVARQLTASSQPIARQLSSSSQTDRMARLGKIVRFNFNLRPHIINKSLSPGKNNLQMSFKNRVYTGSLKENGSIEMNGFTFENVFNWIKSVSGLRYSAHLTADKATLKLLYDGRPLEEVIVLSESASLQPAGKIGAQNPKRRYNQIPLVTRNNPAQVPIQPLAATKSSSQPTGPSIAATRDQAQLSSQPVNGTRNRPPPNSQPVVQTRNRPQPKQSQPLAAVSPTSTANPEPVSVSEPELVPDEMNGNVKKIRVPSQAEYFSVCQCEEQYWNGSKLFSQHLLADLANWD